MLFKNDYVDKMNFNEIKIVKQNLLKTNLINNYDEIISISENKEDIVYPVQFKDYKATLSETKSYISRYSQLYSRNRWGF